MSPIATLEKAVSIGEDTEQSIGDYTEDVVRSGTESNYTPRPNRNFKGVVANKMNCVNVPKYRQWCEVSYQNMIDMEFISKNDTWEMLQAEGRDKELSRQMIYWDNDMYRIFNYSHAFAQAENAIGG